MGRPSDYTQELADRICQGLADGFSLRTVCLAEDMPNKASVFRWLRIHKEFSDQYARAKEEAAELYAEDMLEISDDLSGDVQRDRLRVDTRKWIASKLKPKKYGDKITHEGNEDAPIVVKGAIELVRPT